VCGLLPGTESRTKIPVDKRRPIGHGRPFGDSTEAIMLLIGTDEQCGGKPVKVMLGRVSGRCLHPHAVANVASVVKILSHRLQKRPQPIKSPVIHGLQPGRRRETAQGV